MQDKLRLVQTDALTATERQELLPPETYESEIDEDLEREIDELIEAHEAHHAALVDNGDIARAFAQGQGCASDGGYVGDCPYVEETSLYDAWISGFESYTYLDNR